MSCGRGYASLTPDETCLVRQTQAIERDTILLHRHTAPCVFVLGYGRSGTTLLRRMMSAHPLLFIPPENDAFQRLPPLIGKAIADDATLARVVAACPPYFRKIYDLDRFRSELRAALPMTAPDVFATLMRTARIGQDKGDDAIWGHKMPSEWPYVGTWLRWFPNARFVHIVRCPHDAVASMVEHQLQRYTTTPLVGIWQWRRAHRAIRAHGTALGPDRYMMLRYEDLVTDPAPVLERICRFLNLPADHVEAMIDYTSDASAAHVDGGGHMQRTDAALTSERIGRSGQRDYSDSQTALIDHVCRLELADLGYAPRAARPLSVSARAASRIACAALDPAWAMLRAGRRMRGQL